MQVFGKDLKNFALKWLTQGLMTKRRTKTAIEYLVSNLLSKNKSYTAGYWLARTQVVKGLFVIFLDSNQTIDNSLKSDVKNKPWEQLQFIG